ncbi:MAG: restriction endonuclease [Planctomycetota bacterium]
MFGMLSAGLWLGVTCWELGWTAYEGGRWGEAIFVGAFSLILVFWTLRLILCASHFYGRVWPALSKIASGRIDRLTPRQFEENLAFLLTRGGLPTEVTRFQGDYGVDLIVRRGRERLAFQAKATLRPVGLKAVQEASAGRRYYECTGCGVVTSGVFTKPAVELASANECLLIDGAMLTMMIRSFHRGRRGFARLALRRGVEGEGVSE